VEKLSTGTTKPNLYWNDPSGQTLAESDSTGNTTNEYIYFGGMRIARRDASANVFYYFGDGLGTPREMTTATGTKCYDADFTPFGDENVFTNTCAQNYKFAGLERDADLNSGDHATYREYAVSTKRWLSPDPLGGSVFNPQSLNRYAYVGNNPTGAIDPLGLGACA